MNVELRSNADPIEDNTPRVLTPRKHISHTQVEMYNRCSMQYYFRYVLGRKDRPKISLSVGKGAHAALEYNAKTKIATGADLPLADLLDKGSDLIDAHLDEVPPEAIEADEDPGRAKDDALAAISYFRVKDAPSITPVAAEWEFNFEIEPTEELPEPLRIVNGKIDIIDASVEFVNRQPVTGVGIDDYKFVGRARSQDEVDQTRQLTLYDMAFTAKTGIAPSRLGYRLFLPATKTQPARSVLIPRSPHEMEPAQRQRRKDRLVHVFQTTQKAIQAGIFMPSDDPKTCSWCGFRQQCQYSLAKDDFEATKIRSRTTG